MKINKYDIEIAKAIHAEQTGEELRAEYGADKFALIAPAWAQVFDYTGNLFFIDGDAPVDLISFEALFRNLISDGEEMNRRFNAV